MSHHAPGRQAGQCKGGIPYGCRKKVQERRAHRLCTGQVTPQDGVPGGAAILQIPGKRGRGGAYRCPPPPAPNNRS